MIIAIITLDSSLVPLIDGLCSFKPNPFGFDFSFLHWHFSIFFLKNASPNFAFRPRFYQGLYPSINVHMCIVSYSNTYIPRWVHMDSSGPKCLVLTPSLEVVVTSEYPTCAIWVCLQIHCVVWAYGHINSAFCDGMATTVTVAHHFIWRYLYTSIQTAQVSSGLSHLIKRVVWARCGRRKSLNRYAAENHWWKRQ